jgi:hypothetical protein
MSGDHNHEPATGIPRWAKVTGIIVAVVALLAVAMMLIGGVGGHGPSRHGFAGSSEPSPPPSGHVPPSGAHG